MTVLLPQPLGPTKATVRPRSTSKSSPFSTCTRQHDHMTLPLPLPYLYSRSSRITEHNITEVDVALQLVWDLSFIRAGVNHRFLHGQCNGSGNFCSVAGMTYSPYQ